MGLVSERRNIAYCNIFLSLLITNQLFSSSELRETLSVSLADTIIEQVLQDLTMAKDKVVRIAFLEK